MDNNLQTANEILILQTGGTIDKDYPKRSKGYAFEICDAAAERILQRVQISQTVSTKVVCRKDSREITKDDRDHLLSTIHDAKQSKILITHGTDTLIETALYLESHVGDKVVVLTGAFKPEMFKDSDADFNLGFALGALSCILTGGVYVAINGILKEPNQICKDKISGNFYPL